LSDKDPPRTPRRSDGPRVPPRARRSEGPLTPQTLRFNPFATGLAVFTGIAIPCFVLGYTRPAGANVLIIVIGIAVGLVAGLIAGLWVAARDGRIWKGPQL
jgi:hypothetical protein